MSLSVEMITIDCSDPDGLAEWWSQAAGGAVHPVLAGEFVVVANGDGPRLGFQRVDDPTPGKNRVHIDFAAADLAAEVTRLVALGATETGRHDFGADFRWVVLADPAGNAFCVAAGH
jgi:predicted enzyme related to lactoylglutathione lyase